MTIQRLSKCNHTLVKVKFLERSEVQGELLPIKAHYISNIRHNNTLLIFPPQIQIVMARSSEIQGVKNCGKKFPKD